MKQSALKPLNLAVAIAFAVVAATAALAYGLHTSYQDKVAQYSAIQSQAYEYDEIKKRWSLKESPTVYAYLKSHPNRTKEEKRGGNIVMQFDHLSAAEFDLLSNRILNSMLVIKKLTLQRGGDGRGTIIMEFEA